MGYNSNVQSYHTHYKLFGNRSFPQEIRHELFIQLDITTIASISRGKGQGWHGTQLGTQINKPMFKQLGLLWHQLTMQRMMTQKQIDHITNLTEGDSGMCS
jgi:hypothetical protein